MRMPLLCLCSDDARKLSYAKAAAQRTAQREAREQKEALLAAAWPHGMPVSTGGASWWCYNSNSDCRQLHAVKLTGSWMPSGSAGACRARRARPASQRVLEVGPVRHAAGACAATTLLAGTLVSHEGESASLGLCRCPRGVLQQRPVAATWSPCPSTTASPSPCLSVNTRRSRRG